MFRLRFRFRPGEPVKSIACGTFFLIYCAILAYAIDPSFAISNPDSGRGFDFSPQYREIATVGI